MDSHLETSPIVGIGACLIGHKVRYNGEAKRRNPVLVRFDKHFRLTPFCPEMASGMGVPRQPIRLVGDESSVRAMDSDTQQQDFTEGLQSHARKVLELQPDMAGYILVKGSPSCGMERVKRYDDQGNCVASDATGVFASALQLADPLLPVEEDGRLHDPGLRESFATRVQVYHQWKQLNKDTMTAQKLIAFYSEHKYLVMSHDYQSYKNIGRLLGNMSKDKLEQTSADFISQLMKALTRPASRRSQTNALLHVMGYLKRSISSRERQQLRELIEQYRSGDVPMVVPVTLLRHHFSNHPNEYILNQSFLTPYPDELQLRNQL